jgi:alkanesulfonate monooxygenase SsuD/methylene tetrahydromethanopterin reductase-like flavin-dependent oxidoreductase (luciferase family)
MQKLANEKGSSPVSDVMSRLRAYLFSWGAEEPTLDTMVDFAVAAEELGFDAVHVPWHFTMPLTGNFPDFHTRYLFDPLVLLPVLARETKRIKIAFEFVVPLLHPFVWAQYFASLDQASGGRALAVPVLGWWTEDFKAGITPRSQRGGRMDEALKTMTALWAGQQIDEPGRYWDSQGLALNPRPVQQPMPMWIGGGEKSIERAAKWATALYPLFPTPAEVRDQWLPQLATASQQHGRKLELAVVNYVLATDDAEWFKSYAYPKLLARTNGLSLEEAKTRLDDKSLNRPEERLMVGTDEQCARRLREFLDCGIDHLVIDFYMHGWETAAFGKDQMTRFAKQIVPLSERLGASTR